MRRKFPTLICPRPTETIRPGSIIEYVIDHPILKSSKQFGFVISIDWRNLHSQTQIHVIAQDGSRVVISVCSVWRIIIL